MIKGLHADNGSEHVNHRVAAMLEKLRVEFTRSRPRRSNDNILVESKNGSVVRRYLGHAHIPARFAPLVHEFASGTLSLCLNYHHPCLFATEVVGEDDKARKVYRDADLATPGASSSPAWTSRSSTPKPAPRAISPPPAASRKSARGCSPPSAAPGRPWRDGDRRRA